MTTDNIPQVRQARGTAAKIGRDSRTRSREVQQGLAGLDTEEQEVREGQGVILQSIDDDRDALIEEGEQLIRARQRFTALPAPANDTPPPAEADVVVVQQTPDNPPPAATPAQPVQPTTTTRTTIVERVSSVGWQAWLLGCIGAILGIIVAVFTYDPLFDEVGNDVGRGLLIVLWFIAWIGAGFFGGGLLGARFANRRQTTTTTTTATP